MEGRAVAEVGKFASEHGVEIRLADHGKGTNRIAVTRKTPDFADSPHVHVNWNCDRTDIEAPGFEANFNSVKDRIRNLHLHDLATGAIALSLPGSRVLGANNRVRLGVIGIGSTVKIGRKAGETMENYRGMRLGVIIHCEGGSVRFGSGSGCAAYDQQNRKIRDFSGERVSTKQNFIDCVRSRKVEDLHTAVIEGHLSCGLVHLTNISCRIGRAAEPTSIRDQYRTNAAFSETLDRMFAHLEANEIDLKRTPLKVGRMLTFDPKAERFTGAWSDLAAPLLSRGYRPLFVMPDQV